MHKMMKVRGKEYKLRLSINALSDFKVLNGGRGVMRALEFGDLEFDEIRALYHVALVCANADYDCSVESTGELMQEWLDETKKGWEGLGKLIGEVVTLALGKQESKAKPKQFQKAHQHPHLKR